MSTTSPSRAAGAAPGPAFTPEPPVAPGPRPSCPRCRRPLRVCYCAALPRLETRTRVLILQHPRERRVAIGTARMASLCLPAATLRVGLDWDRSPELAAALSDDARPPILLFPGPGARDILADPPPGPVTLVMVDGTWSQARTLIRDNPLLRSLPRYGFAAPRPSEYRIRTEPRVEYLSTIEALMVVLGVLEGDPDRFRSLLAPLRAMVDAQLACESTAPDRNRGRGYRQGPEGDAGLAPGQAGLPRRQRVPAIIRQRPGDLVCVVGEANAWPYLAGRGDHGRAADELVHWVACRPADGQRFEAVAAPVRALSPSTTFHTGLDEAVLRAGMPVAELVQRFQEFLRPDDVICSWGFHGLQLLEQVGGRLPGPAIDVRALAKRLLGRPGRLEDLAVGALGTDPPPSLGAGRAGRKLARLVALVRSWLP